MKSARFGRLGPLALPENAKDYKAMQGRLLDKELLRGPKDTPCRLPLTVSALVKTQLFTHSWDEMCANRAVSRESHLTFYYLSSLWAVYLSLWDRLLATDTPMARRVQELQEMGQCPHTCAMCHMVVACGAPSCRQGPLPCLPHPLALALRGGTMCLGPAMQRGQRPYPFGPAPTYAEQAGLMDQAMALLVVERLFVCGGCLAVVEELHGRFPRCGRRAVCRVREQDSEEDSDKEN